jgi:hypothetical protein
MRKDSRTLGTIALTLAFVLGGLSWSPSSTTAEPTTPQGYVAINPGRVLDTRPASLVNYAGAKPGAGFQGTVFTGQPGAAAVGVNITLVQADGGGFVAGWASGPYPGTSLINATAVGATIANFVVVPVAADGTFQILTSRGAHLIVDVMGYFAGSPAPPPIAGVSAIITGYDPGYSSTTVTGSVTNNSGATKSIRVDVGCPNGSVTPDIVSGLLNGQTLGWMVFCDGVFSSGANVGVIEI